MLAKPFISQKKTSLERYTVQSIFGNRPTKGSVGLEIEVEGNAFPKSEDGGAEEDESEFIPYQWKYVYDGSLRGFDNAEYVLVKPLEFEQVPEAVTDLWQMFTGYGSVLDESNRTSVHVHLNVQHFRLNRLAAFAGLWFCVEDLLTRWCGDHRVGNMFCLRASDAPAIVSKLRALITKGDVRGISNDDGLHYAGFNTQALAKFGSIEIRTLRGATDPEVIKKWVKILQRLYTLSESYEDDPRMVCQTFSGQPYTDFLSGILGEHTEDVVAGLSPDDVRRSVHQGVRIAQNLCFCTNWAEYRDAPAASPDPFGRSFDLMSAASQVQTGASTAYQQNAVPIMLEATTTSPIHWANVAFSSFTNEDYDIATI